MRAAVLGHPVAHSLSPVLHRAAYVALGLEHTYEAIDVTQDEFISFMESLDTSWLGLSLTMPLKEVAFTVANEVSEVAKLAGSINTLTFEDGIRATNTDVVGLERAILEVTNDTQGKFTIIGSGATARSAIVAAAALNATEIEIVARNPESSRQCVDLARRLGITNAVVEFSEAQLQDSVVTINTTPVGVADNITVHEPQGLLLDVVYHPWPTVLALRWTEAGGLTCSGHNMLLHQAAEQVHLMTGLKPPVEVMRTALENALRHD